MKSNARRLVISDIHGCLNTLKELVNSQIKLTKCDQLYFLGDYIDRGPNSSGVLDFIIDLKSNGFQIHTLMGNHEQYLIDAINEYDQHTLATYLIKICNSPDLLDQNKKVKQQYIDFISSLEYFIELNDFYLVHAGFNFKVPNPFTDKISMLELRRAKYTSEQLNGKRIVHGHQVTHIDEIKRTVSEKHLVIPIDNGCYCTKPHKVYDYTQTGNLCCLNLDTFELIMQRNVEWLGD